MECILERSLGSSFAQNDVRSNQTKYLFHFDFLNQMCEHIVWISQSWNVSFPIYMYFYFSMQHSVCTMEYPTSRERPGRLAVRRSVDVMML